MELPYWSPKIESTKFQEIGRTNKTQQPKIARDKFLCNIIEYNENLRFSLLSITFAPIAMPNTLGNQSGEKVFATFYLKKG